MLLTGLAALFFFMYKRERKAKEMTKLDLNLMLQRDILNEHNKKLGGGIKQYNEALNKMLVSEYPADVVDKLHESSPDPYGPSSDYRNGPQPTEGIRKKLP